MIELLIRIGLVRRVSGMRWDETKRMFVFRGPYIRWPFHVSAWHVWRRHWRTKQLFGVFRNKPGTVKWVPGRLLPRRWGIRIWGLEMGDRG